MLCVLFELPLEGEEVAVGVVGEAGAVAVDDSEIDEFEYIPELIFLDDLVEELRYVCWGGGECAAPHRREDEGVVEVVLSDPEDGAHLVQGEGGLLGEHQTVPSDAWTANRRHGNHWNIVGYVLERVAVRFGAAEESDGAAVYSPELLVHRILLLVRREAEVGILPDPVPREMVEREDEVAAAAQVFLLRSGAELHQAARHIEVGQIQHRGIVALVDEPLGRKHAVAVLHPHLGSDRRGGCRTATGSGKHPYRLGIHFCCGHNLLSRRKFHLLAGRGEVPALTDSRQGGIEYSYSLGM